MLGTEELSLIFCLVLQILPTSLQHTAAPRLIQGL